MRTARRKQKVKRNPVPEDWKPVRKSKYLPGKKLRSDYPNEIVVNLSDKQLAYAEWCAKQLYFDVPDFAYHAVVKAITGWWGVMPDDVQERIKNMNQ